MGFTRVQGSGKYQADGVTGTQTFTAGTSNFTVGNLVVTPIVHYAEPTTDLVTGVTINGDTCTSRVSRTNPTNTPNQAMIFDRTSLATGSAHSTAVTLGGAGATGGGHYITLASTEFSYTGTFSVVGTATADGNSNAPSVTTPAGTQVGDLIYATFVNTTVNSTVTDPSGYTSEFIENTTSHEGGAACSRIAASGGAQAVTWSLSTSVIWSAVVVVYRASTAVDDPKPTQRSSLLDEFAFEKAQRRPFSIAQFIVAAVVNAPPLRRRYVLEQPRLEEIPSDRYKVVPPSVDDPPFLLWTTFQDDDPRLFGHGVIRRRTFIPITLQSYSVQLAQGSYSLSGQSVATKFGARLVASQGSYSLTGFELLAKHGYKPTLDQGSFSINGQSIGAKFGAKLLAVQGSLSISGQAVALKHGYYTVASNGSLAINGQALTLKHSALLQLDQGSYAINGQPLSFNGAKTLTVDTGTFTIIGQDVNLKRGLRIVNSAGAYTVSGQVLLPHYGRKAVLDNGSLALSGQTMTTRHGFVVPLVFGNYSVSGQNIDLKRGLKTALDQGSYSISGQSIVVQSAGTLQVVSGIYNISGQNVTVKAARRLELANGTLAITGQSILPTHNINVALQNGTYSLTGQAVQFDNSFALVADRGTYSIDGRYVSLIVVRNSVPTGTVIEAVWLPSTSPQATWL